MSSFVVNPKVNTIETKYPEPKKKCDNGQVLYRVTYNYKCKQLSGDIFFPITYENFNKEFEGGSRINPGDLVKYTPINKSDINYNGIAKVLKSTTEYVGRDIRGGEVPIDNAKKSTVFYDLEFVNPVVGNNNKIKKVEKNVKSKNRNGTMKLKKVQNEIAAFFCEETFLKQDRYYRDYLRARRNYFRDNNRNNANALQRAENALWVINFNLDKNNEPKYPLMSIVSNRMKDVLNRRVKNIVETGFKLGKRKNRPRLIKIAKKWKITFRMPDGARAGDSVTIPLVSKSGFSKEMTKVIVTIPYEYKGRNPNPGELLENIDIDEESNRDIIPNLKNMKIKENIDLEFKPRLILASEYEYEDDEKSTHMDLKKLIKPSSKQMYTIADARIITQNGLNFSFKKLTKFNKDRKILVFDLLVNLDLTLKLKIQALEDESTGKTLQRKAKEMIMNGPMNCSKYTKHIRESLDKITDTTPKEPDGGWDNLRTDYINLTPEQRSELTARNREKRKKRRQTRKDRRKRLARITRRRRARRRRNPRLRRVERAGPRGRGILVGGKTNKKKRKKAKKAKKTKKTKK